MASQPHSFKLKISSATQLSLERPNGQEIGIHPLWLRERCKDSDSMDSMTGQRLHDPSDLDLNLHYVVLSAPTPSSLHVRFSDGHETDFAVGDILAEASMPPGDYGCPAPVLWDSKLASASRAQWLEHPEDAQLAQWLDSFLRYGFILFEAYRPLPARC